MSSRTFLVAGDVNPHAEDSPTKVYIKHVISLWLHIIAGQDFEYKSQHSREFIKCVSPKFEAKVDGYPGTFTLEELGGIWRQELHATPKAKFSMKECTIYVNERHGTASAYIGSTTRASDQNATIQALTELKWTRNTEGDWYLHRFHGIRGWNVDVAFHGATQ